ncbi:MAG: hypothetical protein ABW104_14260 [Candidatus Thiodiazotropha sp. 6PLUC2]
MITPKTVSVILILILITALAFWSKLRFVDPGDHQEQRWRIDQYPGFDKTKENHKPRNHLIK